MPNAPHILETALLLLAAFLIGAVLGYLTRVLVVRLGSRAKPVIAAVAAAPAEPATTALATEPTVDPTAVPVAPEPPPEADFAAIMEALASPGTIAPMPEFARITIAPLPGAPAAVATTDAMQPARTAGETTSGKPVGSPLEGAAAPPPPVSADAPSAEVIAFAPAAIATPTDETLSAEAPPAVSEAADELTVPEPAAAPAPGARTPAVFETPITASIVAEPLPPAAEAKTEPPAPQAAPPEIVPVRESEAAIPAEALIAANAARPTIAEPELYSPASEPTAAVPETEEKSAAPDIEPPVYLEALETLDDSFPAPPAEVPVAPATSIEPAVAPTVAKIPERDQPDSSDFAGSRMLQNKELEPQADSIDQDPVPPAMVAGPPLQPALQPLATDSEEEESAAMRAIEGGWTPTRAAASHRAELPELAAPPPGAIEPAPDHGKPAGLPSPRHGTKDELTRIRGVAPVIEAALNRLGLYHFDQLAALSADNVAWIETHIAIQGRIAREEWQAQARDLASTSSRTGETASH